jgi:hypothetical protein
MQFKRSVNWTQLADIKKTPQSLMTAVLELWRYYAQRWE